MGHILSIALITAALVVAADVGITLLDSEPISSVYGSIKQNAASSELEKAKNSFPSSRDLAAAQSAVRSKQPPGAVDDRPHDSMRQQARLAAALATQYERSLSEGDPIGSLNAAALGDDEMVVLQGIEPGTLKSGPGHYPSTSLPGQPGTVGVAGHRTTYMAPFREIAAFVPGDEIRIEMPYGGFVYAVRKTEIVTPDRVDVIDDIGRQQLVLTACHPLYSAAERMVVSADLIGVQLEATTRD